MCRKRDKSLGQVAMPCCQNPLQVIWKWRAEFTDPDLLSDPCTVAGTDFFAGRAQKGRFPGWAMVAAVKYSVKRKKGV